MREELVFEDVASLQHICELRQADKVHYGKEALVVTLARVGGSGGTAIPVYAGGSCKSSSERQQLNLCKLVSVSLVLGFNLWDMSTFTTRLDFLVGVDACTSP